MVADLDMAKLRDLAAEFGYWPATTDSKDVERHRKHNVGADTALTKEQLECRYSHLRQVIQPTHSDKVVKKGDPVWCLYCQENHEVAGTFGEFAIAPCPKVPRR